MTSDEFRIRLNLVAAEAVVFARAFVENELSDAVRFHVFLNQSHDGNATAQERVFPEDDGREFGCLTDQEVVDVLFRDGCCPEWIDVAVEGQSSTETRVRLLCCGRYTSDDRLLYYQDRKTRPFAVKSPDLPPRFEAGEKFRLPVIGR